MIVKQLGGIMKKALLLSMILFSVNAFSQTIGTLPVNPPISKVSLMIKAIKALKDLCSDFDFTAILTQPELEVAPNLRSCKGQKCNKDRVSDRARLGLGFPIALPPKAIFEFETGGLFNMKIKWKSHVRTSEVVSEVQLRCKTLNGEDGGLITSLVAKGLFKESQEKQHGVIKLEDLADNECGYDTVEKLVAMMELNRVFVVVNTVETPTNALMGEVVNIGISR